jgi:hypothetical protein
MWPTMEAGPFISAKKTLKCARLIGAAISIFDQFSIRRDVQGVGGTGHRRRYGDEHQLTGGRHSFVRINIRGKRMGVEHNR